MPVCINIPTDVEAALRAEWGDFEGAAREALLIESYRAGKISIGLVARTLGIGVIEADKWLAERGVALNYGADDLAKDRASLKLVLGGPRRA